MEEHLRGFGLVEGKESSFAAWLTGKGHLLPGRVVSEGPSSSILTDPPVGGPGSEEGDCEAPGPHPVCPSSLWLQSFHSSEKDTMFLSRSRRIPGYGECSSPLPKFLK